MLRYPKQYPFSIAVLVAIVILSFQNIKADGLLLFEGVDKVVHFCMYAGVSATLWIEFLYNHRRSAKLPVRHAIIGAVIAPVIFGALIEIGQTYASTIRTGDWLDLACNCLGVTAGSLFVWFALRPWIIKKR
ncbi:MAG: VanZ family protein [Tannerellaceae bacterium]|jgi:VanZ family protein|nr:VanZ family protein [Tannerellaceae bacterium]